MLELCVWLNRHNPEKKEIRVYVNNHELHSTRLYFVRAVRPKGSMKFMWKLSMSPDTPPPSREAIEKVVAEVCKDYGLSPDKTHWFKMLCAAEWPHYYDRRGILTEIASKIRKKGSKKKAAKSDKPFLPDDDVPPPKRRIIRD